MRPLPAPESVPDCRKLRAHIRFAPGQQPIMASLGHRATAILDRCFEPLPDFAPHGFFERPDFVAACRQRDARERLFRAIFWRLADKAVERGQLAVEGR